MKNHAFWFLHILFLFDISLSVMYTCLSISAVSLIFSISFCMLKSSFLSNSPTLFKNYSFTIKNMSANNTFHIFEIHIKACCINSIYYIINSTYALYLFCIKYINYFSRIFHTIDFDKKSYLEHVYL